MNRPLPHAVRVNKTPFKTAGVAGVGAQIPKCFGFRLRAQPVSGSPAAAPYPVTVRDPGRNDLVVFDDSWYGAPAGGELEMGPFTVDPDGVRTGWTWEVTYATEPGAVLQPQPEPGRGVVTVYDSGVVALGAALTSPILDTSLFDQLTFGGYNADGAAARSLFATFFDENGAALGATPTANLGSMPINSGFFYVNFGLGIANTGLPPPRMRLTVAAAGGSDLRVYCRGRPAGLAR